MWKNEKKKYDKFRFTFRSSVEHYYPQTPLDNIQELDQKTLHNFGNLCLVSREKNAKLSNHTPEAKKDYYKSNDYDSLKQQIMMSYDSWNKEDIEKHGKEMVDILNKKLASGDFSRTSIPRFAGTKRSFSDFEAT